MAVNGITKIELSKDDVLLHNGDDVENLYLLVRGKITVYALYGNYTLVPGSVVALTGSNFGLCTYTYVAAEDCVLQSFPCRSSSDVSRICDAYPNDFPRFVINLERFVGELIRTYLKLMVACRKKDPEFALDERINRWELDKYNALSTLNPPVLEAFYKTSVQIASAELIEASRFATVLHDACLTMAEYLNIDMDYVAPPPKPVEIPIVLEDTDVIEDGGYSNQEILQELSGSLEQIISFSGWDEETKDTFRTQITKLRDMKDRTAPDEESRKLRHSLTGKFYDLYYHVFKNSLSGEMPPASVRMFLNFGYIDEMLAGPQASVDLYRLTLDLDETCNSTHIFTIYEWLKKILWDEKQPSRNGLDQSYEEYIQLEVREGRLKGQLPQLLNDCERKLQFEIENVFKQTHYMTYGRVSTFIPFLIGDNVLRPAKDMLVTVNAISEIIDKVRAIDYSLFFRSRVYTNMDLKIGKELVYSEVLPDVILLPTAGTNSVMWQEIEGRNRLSSARMMLPILCNSNLESLILNMLGKYRWEICKRIQGAYWNNISEPSLTAEYCDYLQFYKKNHDLTDAAKQKIHSTLTSCRSNFNEFFARDYENWILHESRGAGKLNKVSRRIMGKYCPFSLAYRNELRSNPMFTDVIEYAERQNGQKRHHIDNIIQALAAKNIDAPREIIDTRAFFTR